MGENSSSIKEILPENKLFTVQHNIVLDTKLRCVFTLKDLLHEQPLPLQVPAAVHKRQLPRRQRASSRFGPETWAPSWEGVPHTEQGRPCLWRSQPIHRGEEGERGRATRNKKRCFSKRQAGSVKEKMYTNNFKLHRNIIQSFSCFFKSKYSIEFCPSVSISRYIASFHTNPSPMLSHSSRERVHSKIKGWPGYKFKLIH